MKSTLKKLLLTGAAAGLSLASAQAATTYTYIGGANSSWSDAANWDPAGGPPTTGDSVEVGVDRSLLNIDYAVVDGATLNHTNNRMAFALNGNLTLESGGTINMVNSRYRFANNNFQFNINADATLNQSGNFFNSAPSFAGASINWIADSDSITTWNVGGSFNAVAGLTLDLTDYQFSNGYTFTLVDYGTLTGTFDSINVIGGAFQSIDYGSGTNDVITITAIPEPSSSALLGLGLSSLLLRRRRS